MSARISPPRKSAPAGVHDYYASGVRAVINGVPTRLARRPSPNMLQLISEPADYVSLGGYCPFTGRPDTGYAACTCGDCAGSPIVLPKRALAKLRRTVREANLRGDLSASQHPCDLAAVKLGSAPAAQRGASETGNGTAIKPDPSSMETDGHPHSVERPGRTARARLVRRYIAMRRQRELDRLALAAAGDYVRQADAERDAAKTAAIPPPVHLDQAPGYGVIALLHRERQDSAVKLTDAETREAALKRMVERLSDEIERLSGRAIRAEQALQVYRVPALAITDQRDPRSVEMREAGR